MVNENCTGIRELLSLISGNVLQQKPSNGGAFVDKLPQSQPRSQDLYGGVTKIPAKTLETRFCDDGIGYRRFEIRAGDVFFPLSNFRCWIMWVKWQQTFQPSRFDRETHGLGCRLTALPLNLTVNQKALKLPNNSGRYEGISRKAYLRHIFEVSRFEVLISRFFWAFFKTSRFVCDGGWKVCGSTKSKSTKSERKGYDNSHHNVGNQL